MPVFVNMPRKVPPPPLTKEKNNLLKESKLRNHLRNVPNCLKVGQGRLSQRSEGEKKKIKKRKTIHSLVRKLDKEGMAILEGFKTTSKEKVGGCGDTMMKNKLCKD